MTRGENDKERGKTGGKGKPGPLIDSNEFFIPQRSLDGLAHRKTHLIASRRLQVSSLISRHAVRWYSGQPCTNAMEAGIQ